MRTLGWRPISAADYRASHERYGGSVATHPDVLAFLHERLRLPGEYLGVPGDDGAAQLAVCRWGRYVAGEASALGRHVTPYYDLGTPELIVPCAPDAARRLLLLRASHLSPLSQHLFRNARPVAKERRHLAMAKGMGADGFSRKTAKRRRLDVKHFLEQGGQVTEVHEHDAQTLADIYRTLHHARWQRYPGERDRLIDLMSSLRHLLFGHVLWMQGRAVAFDFILKADSPRWTSFECVNGGFDPAVVDCSPGSVLIWLNLVKAWEETTAAGREMRFSLGHMDNDYKTTWCRPQTVYRTLTW